MAKNTFFNSIENAKNANFDQLTWTTDCDVIIEHMQNLIVLTDSPLNSVPDRVLEHVPKVKIDQNMLVFSTTSFTTKQCVSIRKFRAFFQFRAMFNQNETKKCDRQTNRPTRPTNFEMLN